MKKIALTLVSILLALMLVFGCMIVLAFYGNPISYLLAKNTAEKYVSENYADTDFVVESVSYGFKDGNYYAFITSPSSIDTHFTLYIRYDGVFLYDCYEDHVVSGHNTAQRINNAYRKAVDGLLESDTFPYECYIAYGDIQFGSSIEVGHVPTPTIPYEELQLDHDYDYNDFAARAGRIVIYLNSEDVTAEHLAEILIETRKAFDEAGISFSLIDFVLQSSTVLDSNGVDYLRIEVMDFKYEDIYSDGMVDRVIESNNYANSYYDAMDAEKFGEIQ